jgi:hypothetical protein
VIPRGRHRVDGDWPSREEKVVIAPFRWEMQKDTMLMISCK